MASYKSAISSIKFTNLKIFFKSGSSHRVKSLETKMILILIVLTLAQIAYSRPNIDALLMDRVKEGLDPEEATRMAEEVKNVKFLLRDRSKGEWFPISVDGEIPDSLWIPGGAGVKLIIHGYSPQEWMSAEERIAWQGIFELGIAYSERNSSYNVFIVDWTVLSTEDLSRYYEAAQATRFVGEAAAKFLIRLSEKSLIRDWDRVHAIGFSLGGHTAGVVGAKIQELAGAKIGRITGIDPAGPAFDLDGDKLPANLSYFLDKGDAKFVDIIHCNLRTANESLLGHLGSAVQAGHADFYPNGGESQTGCKPEDDFMEACSHLKCVEYVKKSLKNELIACPCKDWSTYNEGKCKCTVESGGVPMGDPCPTSASGKYFIKME